MNRKVIKTVFLIHALALLSLIIAYHPLQRRKPKKLIVHTQVARPPAPPPPPKKVARPPRPKKVVRPARPKPKKKPPPRKQKAAKILSQLDQKLKAPPPKKEIAVSVPKSVEAKSLTQVKAAPDQSYTKSLIQFLQNSLLLPEIGTVKMELTITSEGRLKALRVIECESEKNRKYLESTLEDQIFPSHGKKIPTSYILTFCNRSSL